MTTQRIPLDCETFDVRLPDYLEGTLAGDDLLDAVSHVGACLRCSALVRDLEGIRREAIALTDLAPSRDLWSGIAERIEAPVVPLANGAGGRRQAGVLVPRAWLGAIAAGLVVATAGATYLATVARLGSRPAVLAAGGAGNTASTTRDTARALAVTPAATESTVAAAPVQRARDTSVPRSPASATLASRTPRSSAVATYDREIEALRTIVRDRRGDIDPHTVAILDNNLRVIDQAIVESRAAIARDPASRFLRDQLTHVLDKKLELLRTVALLRPRA